MSRLRIHRYCGKTYLIRVLFRDNTTSEYSCIDHYELEELAENMRRAMGNDVFVLFPPVCHDYEDSDEFIIDVISNDMRDLYGV